MKRVKISLVALAIVFGAASAFTTKTDPPSCPLTGAETQLKCPTGNPVCCITVTIITVNGITYPVGATVPGTFTP